MVKQSRKRSTRHKRKGSKRYLRKMVGGAFTQEETQNLLNLGFTQDDIDILSNTGVNYAIIEISLNQINPETNAPFTPQELIQSVNEANQEINQLDISGISNVSDDEHNLDDSNLSINDSLNTTTESNSQLDNNNSFSTMDSLHLSDLENPNNDSMNTTREEESFGGRKRKVKRTYGKTRKGRKPKRKSHSRKQRGGMCYGNGVGANSYDPNFSIYNTRELTLFPYKPTN